MKIKKSELVKMIREALIEEEKEVLKEYLDVPHNVQDFISDNRVFLKDIKMACSRLPPSYVKDEQMFAPLEKELFNACLEAVYNVMEKHVWRASGNKAA